MKRFLFSILVVVTVLMIVGTVEWAGVLIDMIVSLSAVLSSTLIIISSILTLFKDDLKNLLYKGVEF